MDYLETAINHNTARMAHQQPSKLTGPEIILRREELNRVIRAMKAISDSYSEHQSWSEKDAQRWVVLRDRRNELREMLGCVV